MKKEICFPLPMMVLRIIIINLWGLLNLLEKIRSRNRVGFGGITAKGEQGAVGEENQRRTAQASC